MKPVFSRNGISVKQRGRISSHIPKTGGTWIKHVLEELDLIEAPLGHQHSDWDRAFWHDKLHRDLKLARYMLRRAIGSRRAQPRIQPNCFKFCFVREPLQWYESYWRFMQSLDWNWKSWGDENDPYQWHPCAMVNALGSPDFNEFVYRVNQKRPGFVTEMYGWYVRPGIGFVGRQEFLRQDLIRVLEMMNIEVNPDRVMKRPKKNETPFHIPRPEWDPALRKATLKFEHAGYVRYGYSTEGWSMKSPSQFERPVEISQAA